MTSPRLKIGTRDLRVSSKKLLTGEIWLDLGDRAFPERNWSDFVVVIAGWWLGKLFDAFSERGSIQTVHFMDGPFQVELSVNEEGSLELALFDRGRKTPPDRVTRRDGEQFAADVVEQARGLVNACRQIAWWSKDADTLVENLTALAKSLNKPTKH